jgi:hypothetical protein
VVLEVIPGIVRTGKLNIAIFQGAGEGHLLLRPVLRSYVLQELPFTIELAVACLHLLPPVSVDMHK